MFAQKAPGARGLELGAEKPIRHRTPTPKPDTDTESEADQLGDPGGTEQ